MAGRAGMSSHRLPGGPAGGRPEGPILTSFLVPKPCKPRRFLSILVISGSLSGPAVSPNNEK